MPHTSGRPSIAVVTCTYSAARTTQLAALIRALQAQTLPADEVIVVVDHNQELLVALRSSLTGVVVIPNRNEHGLSGGRNTGLGIAASDIIAFIDDDAIPASDWLERIAAAYHDARVIGVGGPVDPEWDGRVPGWFPPEFGWVVGCGYQGLPESPAEVRNFIGCNMSFRRRSLDGSDGFRIDLGRVGLAPVGCEETEFCIRLVRERPGHVLRFEPAARVRHSVPRSRMTWAYFRSRCYAEGRSKARVARILGASSALASERSYVVRTLTRAVVSNLLRSLRGDSASLARAGAIVAGLAATTLGYSVGHWGLATGRERLAPPRAEVAPLQ